nr:hypothetical protein [Pandoravirus massiliensis]
MSQEKVRKNGPKKSAKNKCARKKGQIAVGQMSLQGWVENRKRRYRIGFKKSDGGDRPVTGDPCLRPFLAAPRGLFFRRTPAAGHALGSRCRDVSQGLAARPRHLVGKKSGSSHAQSTGGPRSQRPRERGHGRCRSARSDSESRSSTLRYVCNARSPLPRITPLATTTARKQDERRQRREISRQKKRRRSSAEHRTAQDTRSTTSVSPLWLLSLVFGSGRLNSCRCTRRPHQAAA